MLDFFRSCKSNLLTTEEETEDCESESVEKDVCDMREMRRFSSVTTDGGVLELSLSYVHVLEGVPEES